MTYHTHIFKTGNSLALRLPKAFHFNVRQEVELVMRNNELIVRIVPKNLAETVLALPAFPDDVNAEMIEDLPPQGRDF